MDKRTCPTWCLNKSGVRHVFHTADVAEFDTGALVVEIALSQHGDQAPTIDVYRHTGNTAELAEFAPGVARFTANLITAVAADSPQAVALAEALTLAAATIEETGGAA